MHAGEATTTSRRRVLGLALLASAGAMLPARAQTPARRARIGMLCYRECKGPGYDDFPEQMRARGWVEGRNLEIDRRGASGDPGRLAHEAAALAASRPDLIFTIAPPATRAAKEATNSVPIVFAAVANPVGFGLVASLARPGGNLTGVATTSGNIVAKQIELLKAILPGATRAALIVNPDNEGHRRYVSGSLPADQAAAGLRFSVHEARRAAEIEPAIAAAKREGAELLVQLGDSVLSEPADRIPQLALRAGIPSAYLWRFQAQAGGLLSFGPDLEDMVRRATDLVDRVLKGGRPADLPVEQPTRFDFAVNLATARALGLKVPQTVLLRADKVIE